MQEDKQIETNVLVVDFNESDANRNKGITSEWHLEKSDVCECNKCFNTAG